MSILTTKLYVPPLQPNVVLRPRLNERLNESLSAGCRLILISAPAGFGKTTLLSGWLTTCAPTATWLSLEAADSDPARFLTYIIAALKVIEPNIGAEAFNALQSPKTPPIDAILTALLNEISTIPYHFVLVLDDYHLVEAQTVDQVLTYLLEHLPPNMHMVIASREDPHIPMARLRARGQLAELRQSDLRFTPSEAAGFLNQVMGQTLSEGEIIALETRTEGWIAGLQMAVISLRGHPDAAGFIQSFTGSHRFVMDYLMEEVLQQQSETIQTFLLRTSILDRMCGSLCDAVLLTSAFSGQKTLEYFEQTNLFIVPLDNERRWYRYHHLFTDLLRQRLQQNLSAASGGAESFINELHLRASQWYEDNDMDIEAFHHATAANDLERAESLIDGKGIPVYSRGAVTAILNWLESLPETVLNSRPSLWRKYARLLLVNGQTTGVEEKLQTVESALQRTGTIYSGVKGLDEETRNLVGNIATARAVLALTRYDTETMHVQSSLALEFLPLDNLSLRANANWTRGYAYFFQGDRAAAHRAFTEARYLSQAAGDTFNMILATIGLGTVEEAENQLDLAAETYRCILKLAGDQPLQIVNEAHLGLARILYEWNGLEAAERHGQKSLELARLYDKVIDRYVISEVFLARLKLAQGDASGALTLLIRTAQSVHQHKFVHRIPGLTAARVLILLHLGDVTLAAHQTDLHKIPLSQARVLLAQGNPSAALVVLKSYRQQVEVRGWQDERLRVMVLQAVVLHSLGEEEKAVEVLGDALVLAEPGGFIRLFIDEGLPMVVLLRKMNRLRNRKSLGQKEYIHKLLVAFGKPKDDQPIDSTPSDRSNLNRQHMVEPLSKRELEILQLVAQGLSNREIGTRLFLELTTVKGHNQKIFAKLDVRRRTEAVARARELGLL